MRILLTRPEPDATELKHRLDSLGHSCLVAPVLDIEYCAPAVLASEAADALIATSRNSLRAIGHHPEFARLLSLPVFAVGTGTGALARDMGFSSVIEGPAAARDLLPMIEQRFPGRRARLLHLAGDVLAYDTIGTLTAAGFTAAKHTVYRSVPASSLPLETISALRSGALDACIVLSPRTANHFATLAAAAGVAREAGRLTYFCLSAGVAEKLKDLAPAVVRIAKRPVIEEVLALVPGLAEN